MKINHIIVHEVVKEPQNKAALNDRETENPIDAKSELLVSQLNGLFGSTGLITGSFKTPDDVNTPPPEFVTLLDNHLKNQFSDFVVFTREATRIFIKEFDKSSSQTAGYLWFNQYTHHDQKFLSIVLLRKKKGLIFENDLSLEEVESLDMDKLHMAARINITRWKSGNSQKYISFRIGNNAKSVTDYFSDFIGCEEYTKTKIDTRKLCNVMREYCSHHDLDDHETTEAMQYFVNECHRVLNAGEDEVFRLSDMSNKLDVKYNIDDSKKGYFLSTAQAEPYEISEEIRPDRSELKAVLRYKGSNDRISISFDIKLYGTVAVYCPNSGSLTFNELPHELKAQLDLRARENSEDDKS